MLKTLLGNIKRVHTLSVLVREAECERGKERETKTE